jgi:RNase P subunit RPR2
MKFRFGGDMKIILYCFECWAEIKPTKVNIKEEDIEIVISTCKRCKEKRWIKDEKDSGN